MRLPLPWKWFAALALLLAGLQFVINLCIGAFLPPLLRELIREDLLRHARLLRPSIAEAEDLNALVHQLGGETGLRLTVIDTNGTVRAESNRPPSELPSLPNHLQRPEVQEALRHGHGEATRHSTTVGVELFYLAVLGESRAGPVIIRVALPLDQIRRTTSHAQRIVLISSVAATLAALPVVFWMSRRSTAPILAMREVTACIRQGDFSKKAPRDIGGEVGELCYGLNAMSKELQARLRELADEKAELNATLANMIEGVLVVDADSRIRLANHALQHQMGLNDSIIGRTVMEGLRHAALHDLVGETLNLEQTPPREMTFYGDVERTFDVSAARLQGGRHQQVTGVVVVFHDITRIKKLENMRKEFVANVSHELRTPLSIIKGYVETLLEEPPPEPSTGRGFLQTIRKHADRLETLIGDLLTISALESQHARLTLTPLRLSTLIENVHQELLPSAAAKQIQLQLAVPPDLPAVRGEAGRLHQVLLNLVDNAIKYTPPGGRVDVSARRDDEVVEVCVADNGPGIAAEHLERIFERFYRVDKARSREAGGTGLGLSIVKHIVLAHGGRVWAESQPGQGTRFYVTLPHAEQTPGRGAEMPLFTQS